MRFETKAIHSGLTVLNNSRAIVPPLSPSTVFEHSEQGHQEGDLSYARAQNPNRAQLERLLSDLEEGAECAAFSSGSAASGAVFQALSPGDHILLPSDVYHGTRKLVTQIIEPWGLEVDFVDLTDIEKVSNAVRQETRLIWIESPSNPMMLITDIREVCALAEGNDITVCVDNTWPSPANQLPLELGADLVVHSTTKYLGGHSDIVGGAVVTGERLKDTLFARIRDIQKTAGAIPSPRDCWLLCRSIRTLPYRVRGHNENAGHIARFLQNHPKVEKVFYPGLSTHDGYEVASRQMSGFGGMISFLVNGGRQETLDAVAGSSVIGRATSLGGVETTWEHRRSSEGEQSATPENLIRISVGLEHPDDLMEDLERALGSGS